VNEWITVSSASRKLNVSDRTIRNWIDKGKLIAKKEKGRWLIDDSSLRQVGNDLSDESGKPEIVSVPLDHYDGLTTRLGQLESENTQYKRMLVAHEDETKRHQDEIKELKVQLEYHQQPFWRRWRKRKALPAPENVVDIESNNRKT
jgi:excisionase family DNA binding protein